MWILDKLEKYITIKLSISSMLEWYVLEALVHVDITTPYWIWLNYILNWRLTDLDFEVVWVKHVLRHVKLALATWVRIHWRPNLTCILSNKKIPIKSYSVRFTKLKLLLIVKFKLVAIPTLEFNSWNIPKAIQIYK